MFRRRGTTGLLASTLGRSRAFLAALAIFGAGGLRAAAAQSDYYNLDGGRPMRVEDAAPTERYALSIDLFPVNWEHLAVGTTRLRTEPRVSYGVLPFTDIEVRVPIVEIVPSHASGGGTATGAAGVALGLLHAFNLETSAVPAVAVAGEVLLPVGSLAAPSASYVAKLIVTRTTRLGRFHFNGGGGTYSVRTASAAVDSTCVLSAFVPSQIPRAGQPCDNGPPIIVDTPCDVAGPRVGAVAARYCMAQQLTAATTAAPRTSGSRWFAGLGFDHALPLASTTLTADVVAEDFVGLYGKADWTFEAGARHQVTPLFVLDGGAGWHFAGTFRSVMITFGASYQIALPPFGS
ncbi:MAG TPA: hypothetical protein VH277_05700 [Gemmatimonadaceae bacterium]|jgi:hypothetical protein|nr:hypothetical protein [Gemmatimonadaceae bacterium]